FIIEEDTWFRFMLYLMALYLVWTIMGFSLSAPPVVLGPAAYDLENYDDSDTWDLNTYGETDDFNDMDEEVGTLAPPPAVTQPPALVPPEDYVEEVTLPPRPTKSLVPSTLDFHGPGLFGPDTGLGMPSCLLCVCISGSVYCDDSDLTQIPLLPKETTHFYAGFNKITEVRATDFISLSKTQRLSSFLQIQMWFLSTCCITQFTSGLQCIDNIMYCIMNHIELRKLHLMLFPDQLKRIDLSGNQIRKVNKDAFRSLLQLQDLMLADNNIHVHPELPATLKHIDVRNNQLRSSGMHPEAFKVLHGVTLIILFCFCSIPVMRRR
uniref:LRRNT domain-containing protein n=1 Tax=Cyprinus carpio TaxID=7962 RepID=A0A8C2CAV1_CYPCA